jgi:hypothetical protein
MIIIVLINILLLLIHYIIRVMVITYLKNVFNLLFKLNLLFY